MYKLSNQKQLSCKKRYGPQKGHGGKRCEIQGGGQEMAVIGKNFNNDNSGEFGAAWSWHKFHLNCRY